MNWDSLTCCKGLLLVRKKKSANMTAALLKLGIVLELGQTLWRHYLLILASHYSEDLFTFQKYCHWVVLDPEPIQVSLGFIPDGMPVHHISPNLVIDRSHRDCCGVWVQTSNELF